MGYRSQCPLPRYSGPSICRISRLLMTGFGQKQTLGFDMRLGQYRDPQPLEKNNELGNVISDR